VGTFGRCKKSRFHSVDNDQPLNIQDPFQY